MLRNQSGNLNQSRDKPRVVELYNLEEDAAQKHDLAARELWTVRQLEGKLRELTP